MAHAGVCVHPCRIAPGVEVVLVLRGHFGLIHGGVYEAVRGLHGHHHDALVIAH